MLGIFDSGVGGLTVVKAIKDVNRNLPIIYFGDTARVPWGEKSPETIQEYSKQICSFLLSKKVDKIVIACNTASSVAGNYLRRNFPNIEIIDVIEPTVKKLRTFQNLKKVAVIGTKTVVKSHFYEKKIKEALGDKLGVREVACPLFVPLVEEGWHEELFAEAIAKKYLEDICDWEPEVLVLGCTHYPLLKKTIRKVVGNKIEIVDSASSTADYLKNIDFKKEDYKLKDLFYFSDLSFHYKSLIKNILKEKVFYEKVEL